MGKRDKRKRRRKKAAKNMESRFAPAARGGALDIDAATAAFKSEFPEEAHRVFIINPNKFATAESAVATLVNMLNAASGTTAGLDEKSTRTLEEYVEIGRAVSVAYSNDPSTRQPRVVLPATGSADDSMAMIFSVDGDKTASGFPDVPDRYGDDAVWQQYVLDHELAHAIGGPKAGKRDMFIEEVNFNECLADAYAVMRHFQREGADSDFPYFIADMRNAGMVLAGDPGHMSTDAIERVIEMNRNGELDGMSPQDCIRAAIDIAHETGMTWQSRKELMTDYKDTGRKSQTETPVETARRVAGIGYRTASEAVFSAAKRFLDTAMEYYPAGSLDRDDLDKTRNVMMQGETAKIVMSKQAIKSRFETNPNAIDFKSGTGSAPSPKP